MSWKEVEDMQSENAERGWERKREEERGREAGKRPWREGGRERAGENNNKKRDLRVANAAIINRYTPSPQY